MKMIIPILFIMLSLNPQGVDEKCWNDIKEHCQLEKGQYLLVIVSNITNCSSCISSSINDVQCVLKNNKKNNLSILALVECSRDIELNIFKERYSWQHKMLRIRRDSLKKLGLSDNTSIALFSSYGILLFSENNQKKSVCRTILNLIN